MEIHLDLRVCGVINRFVTESIEIKIAPKTPVQMSQHVQVEGGRHSLRIVIGCLEDFQVFFEVNS